MFKRVADYEKHWLRVTNADQTVNESQNLDQADWVAIQWQSISIIKIEKTNS